MIFKIFFGLSLNILVNLLVELCFLNSGLSFNVSCICLFFHLQKLLKLLKLLKLNELLILIRWYERIFLLTKLINRAEILNLRLLREDI